MHVCVCVHVHTCTCVHAYVHAQECGVYTCVIVCSMQMCMHKSVVCMSAHVHMAVCMHACFKCHSTCAGTFCLPSPRWPDQASLTHLSFQVELHHLLVRVADAHEGADLSVLLRRPLLLHLFPLPLPPIAKQVDTRGWTEKPAHTALEKLLTHVPAKSCTYCKTLGQTKKKKKIWNRVDCQCSEKKLGVTGNFVSYCFEPSQPLGLHKGWGRQQKIKKEQLQIQHWENC